jgi:hypothetical protein
MTIEKLEIIAVNGKVLNNLTLTPRGKERTMVEGNFLSNGIYYMSVDRLKSMIRLRARMHYGRSFELKYTQITNHTH